MRAVGFQLKPAVVILIINLLFYRSCQPTELQVCSSCSGTVLNTTSVGQFCTSSAGRLDGRCCLRADNTSDPEYVVGLDLSNCSLSDVKVEDLQEASTALMIDLSFNPIVNLSDLVFQGFIDLDYMILPPTLMCPGGNASWEKEELKEGTRLCQGQRTMCNQTRQLSSSCPNNSLCDPFGPGFYECNCDHGYHGYKCLRQGEFPFIQVFAPLGVSTVLVSILMWFTQRRKVKSG